MYTEKVSEHLFAIQELTLSDLRLIMEAVSVLKRKKYNNSILHSRERESISNLFESIDSEIRRIDNSESIDVRDLDIEELLNMPQWQFSSTMMKIGKEYRKSTGGL